MRILFITRKYPPSTGGMENAAYELYQALGESNQVTLIAYGGSNKYLPLVYPWLLLRALGTGLRRRPDVIYLQDGIMAPLGWIVKAVLRRPTVMTIHGLEATYQNPLYKLMVTPYIRRATRLVAVSNETKQKVEQGIPGAHPEVVFNGLGDNFYDAKPRAEHLRLIATETGIDLTVLEQHKLIHTNGRLIKRKGVEWFVANVMPKLPSDALYLVSGKGKDQERIEAAIAAAGLEDRVELLGRVSDGLLHALYNTADVFVMPNIPVPGDMEGFGLVALEAASCGTTVVAAKLEGIQDAIIDGQNGYLVEPLNVTSWVGVLTRELAGRTLPAEQVRQFTFDTYSWHRTAEGYERIMRSVVKTNA